jgi:hypothetical protein
LSHTSIFHSSTLRLAMEFSYEKIPRNRLGMVFIILRKKVVISRHSEVYERVNSEARNGTEWHGKIGFPKNPAPVNSVFLSETCFRTEFREFASFFVSRYRTPSFFLLCGIVQNAIPRVFCSAEHQEFRRNKPIVPYIPSSAE